MTMTRLSACAPKYLTLPTPPHSAALGILYTRAEAVAPAHLFTKFYGYHSTLLTLLSNVDITEAPSANLDTDSNTQIQNPGPIRSLILFLVPYTA